MWRRRVRVVPANAGTHTPRRLVLATLWDSFVENIDGGGYGSRVALRLPGTTWIDSIFKQPKQDTRLHLAARCARVVHEPFAQKNRGRRGMPGARCTRSLVCDGGG